MILLADSEGPDQIADVQADLGHHCPHMPDIFSHEGFDQSVQIQLYIKEKLQRSIFLISP